MPVCNCATLPYMNLSCFYFVCHIPIYWRNRFRIVTPKNEQTTLTLMISCIADDKYCVPPIFELIALSSLIHPFGHFTTSLIVLEDSAQLVTSDVTLWADISERKTNKVLTQFIRRLTLGCDGFSHTLGCRDHWHNGKYCSIG